MADDTIIRIDTVRWDAQPNVCWVRVHTAGGPVGLGETYYLPGAIESVVHDLAAGLLLGARAGRRTGHLADLFACANFSGFAGAELRAFSAIDLALWDVGGKAVGQPAYQLLGGACRDRVPVYNTCVGTGGYPDDDFLARPADLAEQLVEQGYHGMKVWPGDQFAPKRASARATGPAGWSAMGPVGHYLSPADLAAGLSVLDAIRDRVGDKIQILLEGHSRWDLNTAIQIARAAAPFSPLWMEDFIQPDSPDDLRRLVDETAVPQAVSERLMSRYPFRQILERAAAHVVMLDVAWTGGLTEARRIADLADTYHLPIAPHDCTGPVTVLANLHLGVAAPNTMITEVVRGFLTGYYADVLDAPIPVADGYGTPPDRPGLGAEFAPGFLERPDVHIRTSDHEADSSNRR
jgi:galactonate dehydratase